MSRRIFLARHPAVAETLCGVCYGSSDVPLADYSSTRIQKLVANLFAIAPITHLFHSGMTRCAAVADALGANRGVSVVADPRLRERCFGDWELRRWNDIHAETGDAMMGMVTDPGTWRPPGGETTFELRDRVVAWYTELPAEGHIVAITHGGPIAVLRGTLMGLPVNLWPSLVPALGSFLQLPEA
jgi:broad specificity phosphatase PhoE